MNAAQLGSAEVQAAAADQLVVSLDRKPDLSWKSSQ